MGAKKPMPALVRFGGVVNHHREQSGLSRAQLAAMVPLAPGYVGQIIRGLSKCSRETAVKLDAVLDAEGDVVRAWDKWVMKTDSPRSFADFSESEATAALLRAVDVLHVYGLFQAEAYARALLPREEDLRQRLRRQDVLERSSPPTVLAILDEGVLYREVGSAAIMREQLERLVELSRHPSVHIQVAPFAYYRGVSGTFSIATQSDTSSVAFLDNAAYGDTVHDNQVISSLMDTFGRMQARALNVEESRAFIRKVIEQRWT
ncbi:helix-turn-helix transcriptional regulator [Actinomadura kijaniata]|uniref:Transcriptional regulator with XRE-family HTH domain n=1 Tax=Actinomadura namibiensis TaxID=182080 RepID=A0A7W3LJB8_ACTNM|nr:helix-turn-helix transcriptional regulator [Actinomadura namibiensis]MBA8949134.1 transcriptional regulator with XRE-family HTH domain [Actinomadura namibiensis]